MRSIVRSNTVYPPFGLDISQTGPFIRDSLYFVLIISLCILFFGMYRCRRCSTLYYSLVLHGIGSAVSILTLLNALKWIHDISQYVKLVNLSMLPWIMSVICSAVFVFNIRTGGRKKSTADGRENHGCSDEKRLEMCILHIISQETLRLSDHEKMNGYFLMLMKALLCHPPQIY